jgi:hypothetical protein
MILLTVTGIVMASCLIPRTRSSVAVAVQVGAVAIQAIGQAVLKMGVSQGLLAPPTTPD